MLELVTLGISELTSVKQSRTNMIQIEFDSFIVLADEEDFRMARGGWYTCKHR